MEKQSAEAKAPPKQPRYQPCELGIELVRGCNFTCPMCPVTANERYETSKFQFIDLDLLRTLVERLDRNASIRTIWFFHFGEPMAHPKYEECLRILQSSEVAQRALVIQHTNGSLLHGHKAEAILDIPIINKLTISFDGWGDKASFERMRGPHFDRVIDNAKRFAEQAAVRRPDLRLTTCSIIPRPGEIPGVDGPSWDEAVSRLQSLFSGTQIEVEPRTMHDYNGGDALELKGAPMYRVKGGCTFVERYSIYLTVNGWAQPCCAVYDERFAVGNVATEELEDLLNNDAMRRIRHELRLDNRGSLQHCKTCTLSVGGLVDDEWLRTFWQQKFAQGEITDTDEIDYIQSL
jgi:radical SAM protein with 4Fe4S-binding SPASM domain